MHPIIVQLDAGEYHFCQCGEAIHEPLCDGNNGPTCRRKARPFSLKQGGTIALCGCGQTSRSPRCDGSHGYPKQCQQKPATR